MKSETIKALAVDGIVFVMTAVLVIAIIVNVANGTFLIWLGVVVGGVVLVKLIDRVKAKFRK